ncbi:MAG: hypothetical protein PHS10_06350 [Thiovulaceae bacterium]|nr:hypothetical protein [Sulfurimonadaceae bacterium]
MSDKKRHSIGMWVDENEMAHMREKTASLKDKYGYSRNQILKVVCMDLLDDEDFIKMCEKKRKLS